MRPEYGQRQQIARLTAGSGGRWLVTTEGSQSIWDLEKMTYLRSPRRNSVSGALERDHEQWKILQVLRWPQVGDYFHVLFEKPDAPQLANGMIIKFRTSSIIRSIERLVIRTDPARRRPGH
ncbi:hypothetical protein [Nesterenkonia ebinurensis]|uniref:hypothetical protein n=1 Tax=Nesterenkonia ebinurensis TaxID=2608252 RepID=UPI00123D8C8A|nr:hypothetical protein [Nesterenkonia ebinurensis]